MSGSLSKTLRAVVEQLQTGEIHDGLPDSDLERIVLRAFSTSIDRLNADASAHVPYSKRSVLNLISQGFANSDKRSKVVDRRLWGEVLCELFGVDAPSSPVGQDNQSGQAPSLSLPFYTADTLSNRFYLVHHHSSLQPQIVSSLLLTYRSGSRVRFWAPFLIENPREIEESDLQTMRRNVVEIHGTIYAGLSEIVLIGQHAAVPHADMEARERYYFFPRKPREQSEFHVEFGTLHTTFRDNQHRLLNLCFVAEEIEDRPDHFSTEYTRATTNSQSIDVGVLAGLRAAKRLLLARRGRNKSVSLKALPEKLQESIIGAIGQQDVSNARYVYPAAREIYEEAMTNIQDPHQPATSLVGRGVPDIHSLNSAHRMEDLRLLLSRRT